MPDDDTVTTDSNMSDEASAPLPDAQTEPAATPPSSTSTDRQIHDKEMQSWQLINDRLMEMINRDRANDQYGKELQPEIDALKASVKRTDALAAEDPGVSMDKNPPPQLSQQQQGGVATAVTSLLKIAAVAGLAYGMRGKGLFHNSMFKQSMASFLNAYAEGNKQATNASQRLWEKNWQMYKEHNREVHERWKDMLNDSRLSSQQTMDIINAEAKMIGEKRAQSAAERHDLMDLQKTITDQIRFERDAEKEVRKHMTTIYQALGKGNEDQEYRSWVMEKPGGKELLKGLDDPDGEYKLDKRYPRSAFLKEKHESQAQEDLKKKSEERKQKQEEETHALKFEEEKAYRAARGRKRGESEETNPNSPMTEKESSSFRDLILGHKSPESDSD